MPSMRQSRSLSMRPRVTYRPSLSVGMRVSPGGRVASQCCSAGRSSTGASSSMRVMVRSLPRLRIVDHGSDSSTRSARSIGVVAPGSRATTSRTTSCGVPRRRYSPAPLAVISRPSALPSLVEHQCRSRARAAAAIAQRRAPAAAAAPRSRSDTRPLRRRRRLASRRADAHAPSDSGSSASTKASASNTRRSSERSPMPT